MPHPGHDWASEEVLDKIAKVLHSAETEDGAEGQQQDHFRVILSDIRSLLKLKLLGVDQEVDDLSKGSKPNLPTRAPTFAPSYTAMMQLALKAVASDCERLDGGSALCGQPTHAPTRLSETLSPALRQQIQTLRTSLFNDAITHATQVAQSAIARIKSILGCAGVAWEVGFDETECSQFQGRGHH